MRIFFPSRTQSPSHFHPNNVLKAGQYSPLYKIQLLFYKNNTNKCCYWFGYIIKPTSTCLAVIESIGNNEWTVIRKKTTYKTNNMYTIIQHSREIPCLYILFSSYVQVTEHDKNSRLFGCIQNSTGAMRTNCLCWGSGKIRGSSGRDGQVSIILFPWWGGRHGHVLFLLRAPCRWQGRALATVGAGSVRTALPLLLVFDSAVLEPDLDLLLWQV